MSRNGSGTFSLLTNSWQPAVNGVPATAADWQALITDVASALTQSVSRDGQTAITGNLQMGGNKLTGLGLGSASGDSLPWQQLFSQGLQQDLASASVTDIGAVNSTLVNVTGTTTITSFGTTYNGPRFLRFAGALTLTNSATLVLPGGANITTAAGDSATVVPLGNPATGWRVIDFVRASGGLNNVTSINGGQLAGLRNRIINGGMQVGQRGSVTFTSSSNLYGWVDRWLLSISGTTVSALGFQAATGAPLATGIACQAGNVITTGSSLVLFSQRIESINCFDLNGKTVTMSGKVRQFTGSAQTATIGISKATAGVDNWGTQAVVANTTLSIPNDTWTPFTFTTTLGASDATNGINFRVGFESLGAQANTQFYLGDCQLEVGSVATTFEQRPIGMELALCQRYYEAGWYRADLVATAASQTIGSSFNYAVAKRATPTVALASPGYVNASGGTVDGGSTLNSVQFKFVSSGAGLSSMATTWTSTIEL